VAVAAWATFRAGIARRKKDPSLQIPVHTIFMAGIVLTAIAIALLGKAFDTGKGHFSILFLLASILYALIGIWAASVFIWFFGLLSLGSWFGAETGYVSGWGAYYLGMNYPLRFVFFGAALVGSSFLFDRYPPLRPVRRSTFIMGMLYLFIALWILSIFGDYGDMHAWEQVKQWQLLPWSLLFGAVSVAFLYFGIKNDDAAARGFGITFLFINLYTRFFETFWDSSNKGIFFGVLGITFWIIGTKAEKIWNSRILKGMDKKAPDRSLV